MTCSNTALVLALSSQLDKLSHIVWGLVGWSVIVTLLLVYVAFYAKHKVDETTFRFADALQRTLLGS